MLFKDYVLLVRQHLQDMRKSDGSLITLATEDGIRWSSDLLAQLCKGQMMNVLRMFTAMKLKQWVNDAAQYQILNATLKTGSGIIDFGTDIPFSRIMNIQEQGDPTKIYDFLPQEDYFDQRYKIGAGIEGAYYTYLYDAVNSVIQAYVLPLPTADVSVQVVVKMPLDTLYDITSTIEMPFVDIDDLLVDYGELEARLMEGNEPRAKDIQASIDLKIKEISSELS